MPSFELDERVAQLRAARTPFVFARVVMAQKPTSSKPGDQAVILADGSIEGFVGGDCAQATVRAQGLAALISGRSFVLRIAPEPEADQAGKTVVVNPCLSGGTLEIFMEPVLPPPLIRVAGVSPIASALVRIGASVGYDMAEWSEDNFASVDAVVIAAHGVDEHDALLAAVQSEIPYVGLIASPKRGKAVLEALDATPAQKARVKTPAGLNIGARTPEEVALSVFAQIIELRTSEVTVTDLIEENTPELTAIDPICNMTVAAVQTSIHADIDGTRWYFCCQGCKKRFVADPQKFVSL